MAEGRSGMYNDKGVGPPYEMVGRNVC